MARQAGRDPLKALGVPDDLRMTPDMAVLVHELLNPPKGEKSESEYDELAEKIQARQDLAESWERAVKTGYTGPRGQHLPRLRVLPQPEPAPMTPCAFPPAPPRTLPA